MKAVHVKKGRCPHCEAKIPHEGMPKPVAEKRRRQPRGIEGLLGAVFANGLTAARARAQALLAGGSQ
jgi:hypothetical protein